MEKINGFGGRNKKLNVQSGCYWSCPADSWHMKEKASLEVRWISCSCLGRETVLLLRECIYFTVTNYAEKF